MPGIFGPNSNGAAKFFFSGGDVEGVDALKILRGILARGYHINRAIRAASTIDHRGRCYADLRTDLAAAVVIRRRLAFSEYTPKPQNPYLILILIF